MNRLNVFTLLSLSFALTACCHAPPPPVPPMAPVAQTTTMSTSSVQNQCTTTEGVDLTEEECAARARALAHKGPLARPPVPAPGAKTVTTGKTCTTVNGVQSCTMH